MSQSLKQHTIKHAISIKGVGLHSGKPVTLTLCPAPINTGLVFRRTDLTPAKEIPLALGKVVETPLCTKVIDGDVTIQTIEHLLSALAGWEIDNIYIDLTSDELPIMDGSSAPFVFMIEAAGIHEQEAPRKFIKITQPIRIEDGDKFVEFKPCDYFQVNVSIDFAHPAIKKTCQTMAFKFSSTAYANNVARARTFGVASQLEDLHQQGLALGGSLDNAIGLSDDGILNPEGLRVRDEFIKHKVLDEEVVSRINKVTTLVGDTIKTVQRITSQLRPEIIDDLGLEAAIEWHTNEFAERNGIKVTLELDASITISPDNSLTLFRIMQESLTNIARHAKATWVKIKLVKMEDSIQFDISDNGIGITANEIKSKKSFGIMSMKERTASIGGTFEICGENCMGTSIKIILPSN